eukprot:TRINITY_DN5454_c0_g2_i1.p1 TRINITY_DN5454_c0_g2~~TRINITY_DN5454_c0_g2_i1.p1  ORF type:complete len:157 (-),score=52.13 TRINITY_DN5454_c0_g2_i1:145-615(-)
MNLYRKTTIGETLAESLQELKDKNELSAAQTDYVFSLFDNEIKERLETFNKHKISLKGKAHNYRHCDSTWTFILNDCTVKFEDREEKTKYCKIVAVDTALTGDPKKPVVKPNKRNDAGGRGNGIRRKRDKKKGFSESTGIKKEKTEKQACLFHDIV